MKGVKCAGQVGDDWLVISLLIEVEFLWSASSSFLLVGLLPAALTPIRACDRSRSSNFDQCDLLEEELARPI